MVFLSYSVKDHFFAELASIKLGAADINVWRDHGHLRAGADWRRGIEQAIADSLAVLVALSQSSVESSYVTYEWAYALGKGKPVIPLKLNDCSIHPKLETIQYFDFSVPGALPWESLVYRIMEIDTDIEGTASDVPPPHALPDNPTAKAILAYLNQRGYQMVSFDRIRRRIDPTLSDNKLKDLVADNSHLFRLATLKGDKPGLAKVIP